MPINLNFIYAYQSHQVRKIDCQHFVKTLQLKASKQLETIKVVSLTDINKYIFA